MKKITLLIMDLDNTVYDWYTAFIPAFYAMIESAAKITNVDTEQLLDEIKQVHVYRNDVEHPFSLLETKTVEMYINKYGREQALIDLDPAFHSFNRVRKSNLHVFDGVIETILRLRQQCIEIAAYTESRYFGAVGRIERLNISGYYSRIYCREQNATDYPYSYPVRMKSFSDHKIVKLPSHEMKPNPIILQQIIDDLGAKAEETAYIGDSLSKDILMAKQVGCFSIWAKYGVHKDVEMYQKLIRISHWNESDIQRERYYSQISKNIDPDFTCTFSMQELMKCIYGPCV